MGRKLVYRILFLIVIFGFKLNFAQTDTEFWTVVPEINNVHYAGEPLPWKGAPGIFRFTTFGLPSTVTLSLPADTTFTPVVLNIPANTTMSYEFWRSDFPTAGFDHDEYCDRSGAAAGSACYDPILTQWCNDLHRLENFLEKNNISKKGVLIEATNDITCYFEIGARYNRDIISLKGKNALGTDFFVPFQTDFNNRYSGDYRDSLIYSAIQIVATDPGITTVHIKPTKDMWVVNQGKQLAGVQYDVSLNQGEVFVAVPHDPAAPAARPHPVSALPQHKLAGTRVWTDGGKKIAVLTTDDLNNSIIGNPDYMADQIVPNNILGMEYIAMRGPSTHADVVERVYVLATKNSTPIYIDNVQVATLNAGQQYIHNLTNKTTHIATFLYPNANPPDLPISVFHVSSNPRQLAAAILPPIDKCTGSFEVALNRSDNSAFYLLVMVRKGAAGGFTINGSAPPAAFSGFTNVSTNTDWESALINAGSFIDVNEPVVLANSIDMFHVAILNGDLDNFYGYFSDFNVSGARAVSTGSQTNFDKSRCEGEPIQLKAQGGIAYNWFGEVGGDNSFDNPNIATPIVNPPVGTHKYYVEVEQTCFPPDTLSVTAIVSEQSVAYFDVNENTCCAPYQISFDNQSTGATSFVWDFGGGDIRYTEEVGDTLYENNTMAVTQQIVGLTASSKCPDYYEDTIFVRPKITAAAKGAKLAGCNEFIDVEFDIIGASGPFVRFEFDFGDGNTQNFNRPADINAWRYTHTYTNLTDSDVSYTAVATFYDDLNICIDTSNFTVTFVPGIARANFVVSDSAGCSPHTVNFVNTKSGSVPYIWDFANGTVSTTATDTTITFTNTSSNPVNYDIYMQVTRGTCTHDTIKRITVYPEFETTIAADQETGCNNLPVTFSQTTVPAIDSMQYDWTFGDGSNSGSAGPIVHTYDHIQSTVQNYPVRLITTSEYNCKDTSNSLNIEVYEFVDANFSVSEVEGCSPVSIMVENISSNNSVQNFVWDIPDNIGDTPVNNAPFTVTYVNQTGTTQTKTITLNNNVGAPNNCPVSVAKNITIHPEVSAQYTKSADTICHNQAVTFTNTSYFIGAATAINAATPNASFHWEFGDGTTSASENPAKVFKNSTGSSKAFSVKLTLNVNGCSSVYVDTVVVHSQITAQLNTDDINICAPSAITLNNTTIGGSTFTWTFSDGSATQVLSDKSSITYNVDNTDQNSVINSKVYLTATAANCSHTDSLTLNVYPHIVPVISPDAVAGCGPLDVVLGNLSTGGDASNPLTYSWNFANGEISNQASPGTVTFSNRTSTDKTYNVTLTATNNVGCSNSANQIITVYPEIGAEFAFTKLNKCVNAGDSVYKVWIENSSLNGNLYQWNFGFSGNTLQTSNGAGFSYDFVHTNADLNAKDIYTIQLTVVDTNHSECAQSTTLPIAIYPPVVSNFQINNNEGCSDPLVPEFVQQSTGYQLSYVWNYANGNGSTVSDSSHTHEYENLKSSNETYVVKLTATDSLGCSATAYNNVTAYPKVVADFTLKKTDDQVLCTPFQVDFDYPDAAINGNQFAWNFGHDNSFQSTTESRSNKDGFTKWFDNAAGNGLQTYYVGMRSTDANTGCTDTVTKTIKVYPRLVPGFTADKYEGCNALDVVFNNTTSDKSLNNYKWDFGDNQTSPSAAPKHTFGHYKNTSVTFNVTMEATQTETGCAKDTNANVTVYSYLNAKFGIKQASANSGFGSTYKTDVLLGGCSPFDVLITDSSTCNGTWYWDFGDGSEEEDNISPPDRTLTYNNEDDEETMQNVQYTIGLVVENQQGCTKTTNQIIEVYPRSTPDFSVDLRGCHPHEVTFKNKTVDDGTGQYYWRLGDGATSVEKEMQHTYYNNSYSENKSFDVTLVSTTSNLCSDSVFKRIIVYPKPLAAINPIADRGCSPLTAILENQSKGADLNYLWDFDDGNPPVAADSATVEEYEYENTGEKPLVKYVKLVAETEYECRDTVTQLINIYPQVTANIIAFPKEGCAAPSLNVNFDGRRSENGSVYYWEFDAERESQLSDGAISFFNTTDKDTVYTIYLEVQSEYGCKDNAEQDITVWVAPNAEFFVTEPDKIYSEEDKYPADTVMQFNSLVRPGPWEFAWNYGDGSTSDVSDINHDYAYTGWGPSDNDYTYKVSLFVSSEHCSDVDTQLVKIRPPKPYIRVMEGNPAGCEDLTVDFEVIIDYAPKDSIYWNFGNGDYSTEFEPTYTYENPGIYVATAILSGEGGMSLDTIRIQVYPTPKPNFAFSPDFVMLPDQPIQCFNTTVQPELYNFVWDFGDGVGTDTVRNPTYQYKKENLDGYTISLYTQHKTTGCDTTIYSDYPVRVSGEGYVRFPNAFLPGTTSPSNGGYTMYSNNVFHPTHDGVKEYELWIFNRWGEQIFYSDNVDVGWNGRYGNNGAELGQDVYFWKSKGKFNNDYPFKMAGDVTLIRQ